MIDVLSRRRKNNPLIVGEAGVGKTALVEGLALRIAAGEVPERLRDAEVFALDMGSLQAGASVQGEFQRRLKSVLDEVKASPKPIVLSWTKRTRSSAPVAPKVGGDAANLLKPALARGELRTIAATAWVEYKRYFEKDAALERRFQLIKVEEPSIDQAIGMLRGLAPHFEQAHGVVVRDEAVRAAVVLSSRYLTGRQLPDKAVDLLDTAAARVTLSRAMPPAFEDAQAALRRLEREREALGREAARGHASDEAARGKVRIACDKARARVEGLARDFKSSARARCSRRGGPRRASRGRLGRGARRAPRDPPGAAPGARRRGRGSHRLRHLRLDGNSGRTDGEERRAGRARPGAGSQAPRKGAGRSARRNQPDLRAARSGLKSPESPLGVFLLVGPSGVGKTETALALAELLFGGERFLIKIDMGEFGEKHTVSRLIGSPPGYVGYGEGGKLTEAVRQRPYSVVLLDEVEKAHPDVMNIFYGAFEKGVLTTERGAPSTSRTRSW